MKGVCRVHLQWTKANAEAILSLTFVDTQCDH